MTKWLNKLAQKDIYFKSLIPVSILFYLLVICKAFWSNEQNVTSQGKWQNHPKWPPFFDNISPVNCPRKSNEALKFSLVSEYYVYIGIEPVILTPSTIIKAQNHRKWQNHPKWPLYCGHIGPLNCPRKTNEAWIPLRIFSSFWISHLFWHRTSHIDTISHN